jgi:hypothetical protein
VRTSEECAKSLLAILKGVSFDVGEALSNRELEKEFFATGGSGADYMSAQIFACERHWIKIDGATIRITPAGLAAV